MRRERRKSVAIIFWEGYLGVAPSLINAARLLSERGYDVDIITRATDEEYSPIPQFLPHIRIVQQPRPNKYVHTIYRKLLRRKTQSEIASPAKATMAAPLAPGNVIAKSFETASSLFIRILFFFFCLRHIRRRGHACFIGVDTDGLVMAGLLGSWTKTPVASFSLELKFMADCRTTVELLCKRLERRFNRCAVFTVIQDTKRADALVVENGIDAAQIIIVPNGPLGPTNARKSPYLKQRFGLPDSQRLILHMGLINPSTLSLELASVAATWPESWKLILHERKKRDFNEPYLQQIQRAGQGNVLLSLTPVSYDEIDRISCSADIGVALYRKEDGLNNSLMEGASGKLGQYLRCGLPVICLDLPGLTDLIKKYQCGVTIKGVEHISEAIKVIESEYAFYSSNALRCYDEAYEFGGPFQKVIEAIERL